MARSALWLPAYSLICGTSSEKQAGHTSAYSATLENKGWDTQGRAERGSAVLSRDPHTWHPRGVKGSGARGQATWTGKGSTGPPHGRWSGSKTHSTTGRATRSKAQSPWGIWLDHPISNNIQ